MKKQLMIKTCYSVLSLSVLAACNAGIEHSQEQDRDSDPAQQRVDVLTEPALRPQVAGQTAVIPPRVRRETTAADSAAPAAEIRQQEAFGSNVGIRVLPASIQRHDNLAHVMPEKNRENYGEILDNRIRQVSVSPVSTFSIDVDTASYSNVRRFLGNGQMPPADAVRTEELVNYFSYQYPLAGDNGEPFSIYTEFSASPWSPGKHLLHVGLQAVEPDRVEDRAANLVFLVDVSGSMQSPDKLELLKSSLKMLTRQLDEQDRVSLVVYAGASGVVLKPTPGNLDGKIIAALERLHAGGSTNGAAGIELAYQMAQDAFIDGGINRVILATDGDFNVGLVNFDALKQMISDKRKTGISLTTLGFGSGNINDHLMEQLADNGNGNYAYIDSLFEARKVLVDEMSSTLQTVASDVKIQIEFNPTVVAEYRLVGYENRLLNREDFNNDRIDAGEIGAGHTVTALYEISLANGDTVSVDPLRYGNDRLQEPRTTGNTSEYAFLRLRYKAPEGGASLLIEQPLQLADIRESLEGTSDDYRFSAAVAGFSQILRQDNALGSFSYEDVIRLASGARGDDAFGYRAEFINLVRTASALN